MLDLLVFNVILYDFFISEFGTQSSLDFKNFSHCWISVLAILS